MLKSLISLLLIAIVSLASCQQTATANRPEKAKASQEELNKSAKAYFASGCFWCVEAIFESVNGVKEVVSGYSGGAAETATYNQIGSGMTGHAESVEVYYDPKVVTYETLLKVFFGSHDPTTLNQQGPDRGTQYRSAIFYQNEEEKSAAEKYISELQAAGAFKAPITTELSPLKAFYPAEAYHQDYERLHPEQPYVLSVSIPRLNDFKRKYPHLLKKED